MNCAAKNADVFIHFYACVVHSQHTTNAASAALSSQTLTCSQTAACWRGVAMWWTAVDMSAALSPAVGPQIQANPVRIFRSRLKFDSPVCKSIRRMRQICCFHWASRSWKVFSFWGLCPWPLTVAPPLEPQLSSTQTLVISSHLPMCVHCPLHILHLATSL